MEKYVPWVVGGVLVYMWMGKSSAADERAAAAAAVEREKAREHANWQGLLGLGGMVANLGSRAVGFAEGLVAMVGGSTTPTGGTSTNAAAEPPAYQDTDPGY